MIETLMSYDYIEWIALLAGIAYAVFSAFNKSICWVFGIISCLGIAYKDFTDWGLYFDGALQIIYVFMGFMGLYHWVKKHEQSHLKIHYLPIKSHLNAMVLFSLLAIVLAFLVKAIFNPNFAMIDSFTTMFSIWATWLLVNRIYENWIYWIIIDVVYVYIYYRSGGDLISALYVLYTLTAISGLFLWRRLKYKQVDVKEYGHH